ncbi:nuclear pore complex protein Nup88 [Danaus plexippus plexippus]|uniref:Nuclear pore complex protein Nup88 n=1 Tax=Danaus plexippus plexippus TaxID=278856 RepID=A0A212F238_DANPL|nr:nuclear pore complex protein Nup88 [Danaus plexippus plexippus]
MWIVMLAEIGRRYLAPPSRPLPPPASSPHDRRLPFPVSAEPPPAVPFLTEGAFRDPHLMSVCINLSSTVDERFLYSQGEIHRVHWHPKSLSHILVLVSDNTMRLYNIALKTGPKLVKIFTIGPKPAGALGQTVLDSLGDTAIDFTPTPDNEYLLILSGNGDVYMLQCELDMKNTITAKLRGPLAMYPPADDNYGSESCSITAVGSAKTPTLVIIASASATLYHCLLLPNSTDKEEDDGFALYVLESVELNLVQNSDSHNSNIYPVHLYPSGRGSYVCVHDSGVHSVLLPAANVLHEYASAREDEMESVLQLMYKEPSKARHLICGSNPPVGVTFTEPPLQTIIILCQEGDLLTRTVDPFDLEEHLYKEVQLKNPALEQDDINAILKEKQKITFSHIIHEVLQRNSSQPILKLQSAPRTKQCLELLTQATVRLGSEYMDKQKRACDVITRKMAALSALSRQHKEWLRELQKEIEDVKLTSVVLKEKRALAEKHQEDIKYRCSMVSRALRAGSGQSEDERRQLKELEEVRVRTQQLQGQLEDTRSLVRSRGIQIRNWQEDYMKKNTVLGKSHSDSITSILQQQTTQISTLIEETKLLKDQLGIV